MKRGWILVLALSIGLNAGLLVVIVAGPLGQGTFGRPFDRPHPGGGPMRGPSPWRHGDSEMREQFLEHRLDRLAHRLDLDEEQQGDLAAIFEETWPRIFQIREKVRDIRDEIRMRYSEPVIDSEEVLELVGHLNEAQARLDSLVAETLIREAEILTPEQREGYLRAMPWERMLERGMGKRKGGRGR